MGHSVSNQPMVPTSSHRFYLNFYHMFFDHIEDEMESYR